METLRSTDRQLVIGVDEAGLGPNLGPLVIAATVWSVPSGEHDLFRLLETCVEREPGRQDSKLLIADSKQVYHSGGSLEKLETGVLSLLSLIESLPRNAQEMFRLLVRYPTEDPNRWFASMPAYFDCHRQPLPCATTIETIRCHRASLQIQLAAQQICLEAVAARILLPNEFNAILSSGRNKAEVLSLGSMQLVRDLIKMAPHDVTVFCDRHGGRARYTALVQEHLTDRFVWKVTESPKHSRYRWHEDHRDVEISFTVGGECQLPVAAASMTAKYVRELMMARWNQFWRDAVPNLRPTAGYPVDARRFKAEIAQAQARLGIRDPDIWRQK